MSEKQKPKTGRKLFVLLFWIVVLLGATLYLTTFRYSGEKGMARITIVEQPWLEKFERLDQGMTYEQVVAILGEPDRGAGTNRPSWRVDGSGTNQTVVYFSDGKARRIFWMHLGRFALSR